MSQIELRMHDPSTATHVFEHRVFGSYLLRNVEIRDSGNIYADYGLMTDRGTFLGWASEDPEDPSCDKRPGLFIPPSGRLRPIALWWREHQRDPPLARTSR